MKEKRNGGKGSVNGMNQSFKLNIFRHEFTQSLDVVNHKTNVVPLLQGVSKFISQFKFTLKVTVDQQSIRIVLNRSREICRTHKGVELN